MFVCVYLVWFGFILFVLFGGCMFICFGFIIMVCLDLLDLLLLLVCVFAFTLLYLIDFVRCVLFSACVVLKLVDLVYGLVCLFNFDYFVCWSGCWCLLLICFVELFGLIGQDCCWIGWFDLVVVFCCVCLGWWVPELICDCLNLGLIIAVIMCLFGLGFAFTYAGLNDCGLFWLAWLLSFICGLNSWVCVLGGLVFVFNI